MEANKSALTGENGQPGDPARFDTIRRARTALLSPLRSAGVSVAFRLEYDKALVPALKPLAASSDDDVAVNALTVAGELATQSGLSLVEAALTDERPAVRLVAAVGVARALRLNAEAAAPAITPQQRVASIRKVGEALEAENDAHVLDALALALGEGVRSDSEVGSAAMLTAGRLFGGKVCDPQAADRQPALLRITRDLATPLTAPNTRLSNEAIKESAGLAGQVIAYVLRRVEGPEFADLNEAQKTELQSLAGQAGQLYLLANGRLGGGEASTDLAAQFARGPQPFRTAALAIIAPEVGALTKPPFGFPAARFLCE